MLGLNFVTLVLLLKAGLALAVPSNHAVHEKRATIHPRWTKAQRVHSRSILPMRIGLAQSNLEYAHLHLLDVSDPDSKNYGKHWTSEEIIQFFHPSNETIETVRNWLVDSGITIDRIVHTDNKAWFAFDATADEAERILHTEYYEYEDSVTGGILPACEEYYVPIHVQKHIDYVTPGIKLLAPPNAPNSKHDLMRRTERKITPHKFYRPKGPIQFPSSSDLSKCDSTITPACVAALYSIPPAASSRKPNPSNVLGIYESEAQYYYQPDLDLFFSNFTPYIKNGTHPTVISIDGGPGPTNNTSEAGGEVELDLQLAYPIVYPQGISIYQEDDAIYELDPNQTYTYGFNHLLDAIDGSYCTKSSYGETGDDPNLDPIYPDPAPGGYKGKTQCGVYKSTNVISFSYGGQEAHVPWAYQKRQCDEYLKLGLRGVSFIFASGDAGVGNYPEPYSFDGPTGCLGPQGTIFNPTWPNNCPWVTNVGATKVYPGKTVFEPESAVFDPAGHPYHVNFSSGGGFSNVYTVPDYQKSAVDTFFAKHNPPYKSYSAIVNNTDLVGTLGSYGGIYNRIGRGIPDVAAVGDNIATYVGGEFGLSGGTSASCPIFASVVNRINEERLAIGKTPVGFLNAVLYKNPWVLNDITNGTNPGCGTDGFSAVQGWDPVTGLGTPNYPKMLALFLSLP
ncbi:putative protease S8 tripeptidyl peptidase I [Pseudovirgaria hyperparasitica]|uniref:Protease S8 tripeptidyl peptidase I n=1 Tax=Pseudovirgaria hyperparasitica TaxID=470096 RepID=A0A6A6WIR4_9PEZI|nr:putative protease S8 tripeptidyl peptidase I [Pseudovirgaria hyperparasitica]KAF2761577.1 putative protease S8 tripeptidyl peptidase I [Pseudovirgaria hyperparasitica]